MLPSRSPVLRAGTIAGLLAAGLLALALAACGRADPGWIVFVSDRDGDEEIYVIRPDGTGLSQRTDNAARDRDPAWSADGRRIAFVSDRDGTDHIYVMDADGSNVSQWTTGAYADRFPAWAPGGQQRRGEVGQPLHAHASHRLCHGPLVGLLRPG
jgi:dipeptidyl aminopeptidase/acylaminoacyl peptidase